MCYLLFLKEALENYEDKEKKNKNNFGFFKTAGLIISNNFFEFLRALRFLHFQKNSKKKSEKSAKNSCENIFTREKIIIYFST